jgi:hypothetical protein
VTNSPCSPAPFSGAQWMDTVQWPEVTEVLGTAGRAGQTLELGQSWVPKHQPEPPPPRPWMQN